MEKAVPRWEWRTFGADLGPAESRFLGEIVRPHTRLAAVPLEKECFGRTLRGCLVEFARLRFEGMPTRTAAVEAVDPLAVLETVRTLGLAGFEDINYVKALKRLRDVPEA